MKTDIVIKRNSTSSKRPFEIWKVHSSYILRGLICLYKQEKYVTCFATIEEAREFVKKLKGDGIIE